MIDDLFQKTSTTLETVDNFTKDMQLFSTVEGASTTRSNQFAIMSTGKEPVSGPVLLERFNAAKSGVVNPEDEALANSRELANKAIDGLIADISDPTTPTTAEDISPDNINSIMSTDNAFVVGTYNAIGKPVPASASELLESWNDEERQWAENARAKLSTQLGEEITFDQLFSMDPEAHGRALTNDISKAFTSFYMQEWFDSSGWIDGITLTDGGKLGDLVEYMFPFVQTKDRADVASIWGVDLVGEGSIQNAVIAFNEMPAAQQAMIFPDLVRALAKETDGNMLGTANRLAEFLDVSDLNEGWLEVGLDVGLGFIDVGLIAGFFARQLRMHQTSARGVALLKNFGNRNKAGQLNAVALRDEAGVHLPATTTPQDVAAANAIGANFRKNMFDPLATDGIAAHSTAAIEADQRALLLEDLRAKDNITGKKVDQIRDLAEDLTVTNRGVLRPDEREAARGFAIDNFADLARRHGLDSNIVAGLNPRVIDDLQDGFIMEVTVGKNLEKETKQLFLTDGSKIESADPSVKMIEDGSYNTVQVEIKMTQDALTGAFNTVALGLRGSRLGQAILSPSAFLGRLTEFGDDLVSASSAAGLQKGKLKKTFDKMVGVAYRGVSSKGRDRMNSVLIAGDEFQDVLGNRVGRIYTRTQLSEGVTTPEGIVKLVDPKEQDSYYAVRELFNIARAKADERMVSNLRFKGIEETKLNIPSAFNPSHTRAAVQVVEDTGELAIREVFDTVSGKGVSYNSKAYNELMEGDVSLVRIEGDPVKVSPEGVGERSYKHVVIPKGTTTPITTVLRNHTGYVPVIRENVYFVARVHGDIVVDGVRNTERKTVRLFDNEGEAFKWANANSNQRRKVVVTPSDSAGFVASGLSDEIEAMQFGGSLYSSSRSSRDILLNSNGTRPDRVNAMAALDRNLNAVSKSMAYNAFRMQSINKFLTTANKVWDNGALSDPSNWLSEIRLDIPTELQRGLETTRNYLKQTLGLETPDERIMASIVNQTASFLETRVGNDTFMGGTVAPRLRMLGSTLRSADPSSFLRGLTFHALLGGFNVSSGVIQAVGAVPALSLHPIYGATAFAQWGVLRNYIFAEDITKAAGQGERFYLKTINKAFENIGDSYKGIVSKGDKLFHSAEEMQHVLSELKESGLIDAIKTQADYATSIQGYGVGARTVKNLLDKGTVFFNEGEMFSRAISYLVARQELIVKDGLDASKKLTPDQFNFVLDRSRNLTLNLDNANAATYQKGWIGVPMQFFQVTGKYVESMIGLNPGLKGDFTRSRIFGGQVMAFGARGVPILGAGAGLAAIAGVFGEDAVTNLSEEERVALEGGLASYLLYANFNADVNIASRASLAEGLTNMLKTLNKDRMNVLDALAGASGVLPKRTLEAIRATSWLYASLDEDSPIDLTFDKTMLALQQYASVFSSVRNARIGNALLGEDGWRDPTTGELLIAADDVTQSEAIFQVFGFRPRVADTSFILSMSERERKIDKQEVQNAIVNAYNFFLDRNEDKTNFKESDAKNLAITVSTLLRSFPRSQRADLYRNAVDVALQTDSRADRFVKKYIEDRMEGVDIDRPLVASPPETVAIPRNEKEK